jgi:hypothetical protein
MIVRTRLPSLHAAASCRFEARRLIAKVIRCSSASVDETPSCLTKQGCRARWFAARLTLPAKRQARGAQGFQGSDPFDELNVEQNALRIRRARRGLGGRSLHLETQIVNSVL